MRKEETDREYQESDLHQHYYVEELPADHAWLCFNIARTLCMRTGTLNGLAMWSAAPSSRAASTSRSPVRDVSITTLLDLVISPVLSRRSTSSPFSAGMSTSSRIRDACTSGALPVSAATAVSPSAKVETRRLRLSIACGSRDTSTVSD